MGPRAGRLGAGLLAGTLGLLACGEPQATHADAAAGAGGGYPVEVHSADGVTMRIERAPRRVLPTNTAIEELVRALVGRDRICALPETTGDYSNLSREGWEEVPRIQGYEAEPLLVLEPDLVVVHPWQAAGTTAALRRAGVDVLVLPDTTSLEGLFDTLDLLGTVLGVPERSDAVVADLRARVARLAETGAARRDLRVMGYANFGMGGTASGRNTTMDVMIGLSGMRNAAAEAGLVGYQPMDFEELITIDPDVIVLGSQGDGFHGSPTEDVLRREPILQGLSAVQKNRIVVLPSKLFATNSQFLVAAAEELARRVDGLVGKAE